MYRKCKGLPDRWYSVCTIVVILDNCFTELALWPLMFFLRLHHFLTLSTLWKDMEILKKEGLFLTLAF